MASQNGRSTLPRDFRFHYNDGNPPKTPEPQTANEPQPPSPPRHSRLKIRKRTSSQFHAPTEHFLASVAAADIPIPTIEEPEGDFMADAEMPDCSSTDIRSTGFLSPAFHLGNPMTPVPTLPYGYSHRPDWSADDDFSRPTSSHSNGSEFSEESHDSHFSRPSDNGSFTSPEASDCDPFEYPALKSKGKLPAPRKLQRKAQQDVPWSTAQSTHLWSNYLLYLSDPTVTPFRIGASSIPPQGIVHRVAREAKRSWKGPKSLPAPGLRRSARLHPEPEKEGSLTPTAQSSRAYAPWPHSSKATRTHLRHLCKTKDSRQAQRQLHLQSRSPTPFSKARRTRTPEPRSFDTGDMALSLTTSSSASMQPNGPLANLAAPPSLNNYNTWTGREAEGIERRRLGSPFNAHTYGPSTTRPTRAHDKSVLRSPVRFGNAGSGMLAGTLSLNGTMKRRAQHSLDEDLGPILRPSVLNEQLFGPHSEQRRVRTRGFSLGEPLFDRPTGFRKSPTLPEMSTTPFLGTPDIVMPGSLSHSERPTGLLPAASFDPPRLRSPFDPNKNATFPRRVGRVIQDGNATIRPSHFATMHQTRRSIESFDFGEGPSLQSRLNHLDDKLKEIREREGANKRRE